MSESPISGRQKPYILQRLPDYLFSQTQTNTFESVNTLSDNVAQSLAAIGECLTLLRHNGALRQNYTVSRRLGPRFVGLCLSYVLVLAVLW